MSENESIKPGASVRVKADKIQDFRVDFQKKVAGRVGVVDKVVGYGCVAWVDFPAVGRKHPLRAQFHIAELEVTS